MMFAIDVLVFLVGSTVVSVATVLGVAVFYVALADKSLTTIDRGRSGFLSLGMLILALCLAVLTKVVLS